MSDDFFKKEQKLLAGGNRFIQQGNYLYVAKAIGNNQTELQVSVA
jgi:hypothetical protein